MGIICDIDLCETYFWRNREMKKWNAPAIAELNIDETAGGFINVDWEGPFDFLFGKDSGNDDSSTPETEDVVNPLS